VQFIEKNSFNVRSAVFHLTKDGAGVQFLLFPMIHVGSQAFYDDVADRLIACDLILAEGVSSKRVKLLTLSYRIVKQIKRMDLVSYLKNLANANGNKMVGIVYGARHMRNAINFLVNVLDYRVAKADWITVFDL
jgi:hypothetical protein